MSRRGWLVPALVTGALALPGLAFVRSTTVAARPDQGLCLWWGTRQIGYVVNASAFTGAGCAGPSAAAALVRGSVATWMTATHPGEGRACTDLVLTAGGDTTRTDLGFDRTDPARNVNLVVFRRGLCSEIPDPRCHPADPADIGPCVEAFNCWSHGAVQSGDVAALTTTTFDATTGEIVDADTELHGWNGVPPPGATGFYFTCAAPPSGACPGAYSGTGCVGVDLGSVATHEAGHVLGLDHVCRYPGTSCDPSATMFFGISSGDTSRRSLAPDDVDGVCAIYPTGRATVTCAPPLARSGCATGSAGALSLLGVAFALAGRRSRGSRGRCGAGPRLVRQRVLAGDGLVLAGHADHLE